MQDAVLLELRPEGCETEPGVERLDRGLGMQPGLAGTFRPRQIERSAHERQANLLPARRRQHRDPLDLNGPAAIQPAQTQGPHGITVAKRQQMSGRLVAAIELERFSHALLGDEHRAANRQRLLELRGRSSLPKVDARHDQASRR